MADEITYREHPDFEQPTYEAYEPDKVIPFALVWERYGEWTAIETVTNAGSSATGTTREEAVAALRAKMGES